MRDEAAWFWIGFIVAALLAGILWACVSNSRNHPGFDCVRTCTQIVKPPIVEKE